jgi:uncharacterized protein (TIGR00369 family)
MSEQAPDDDLGHAPPNRRTFEWESPALHVAAAAGKTGLAFLQAILAGTIPQAPISHALGYLLVAAADGFARFEGTPAEYHYNPMGAVHGGFACTLLDSAMGAAVMSTLDERTAYTTVQLAVHLTRAISRETGVVAAEGRVIHRGGRVATAEARLCDAAGALLAHGTTTCVILPRRA